MQKCAGCNLHKSSDLRLPQTCIEVALPGEDSGVRGGGGRTFLDGTQLEYVLRSENY